MKRSVKLALWLAGALLAIIIMTPAVLSATPAEPKYLCAQCHTMDPQYQSYLTSAHAGEITCSSCHVPHKSVAGGLAAKYSDGVKHVLATVRGEQPAGISEQSLETVVENCASCHTDVMHVQQPESHYCITCHADEPHGNHPGAQTAQKGK